MKYINLKLIIVFTLLLSFSTALAQKSDWTPVKAEDQSKIESVLRAYAGMAYVPEQKFLVPTVVQLDINNALINKDSFSVYDITNKKFVGIAYVGSLVDDTKIIKITDNKGVDYTSTMTDERSVTATNFYPTTDNQEVSTFDVTYNKPITTDSLNITYQGNSFLPEYISIRAKVGNEYKNLVVKAQVKSGTINFPNTTSTNFKIDLYYKQSISVSDIKFKNVSTIPIKRSIKFLYQVNAKYAVYGNSDTYVLDGSEGQAAGFAFVTQGVKNIGAVNLVSNPQYAPSDSDGDNIPNKVDNCPQIENNNQSDLDQNGVGDVCDDYDKDMVVNSKDNCPNEVNFSQLDTDGDGIGDACDTNESRITEKEPAIVWIGLSFATLVLVGLMFVAFQKIKHNANQNSVDSSNNFPPQA